jgi:nickel superoxide dismutase
MKKAKKVALIFLITGLLFSMNRVLLAHCQVPCGIYDDPMRFKMIAEHITTIEKAMKLITELSEATPVNYNQIVRWVTNKEKHAEELSDILGYYFLAQRIKPVSSEDEKAYKPYLKQLELIHHLIVFTMKAKQSTDLSIINKLRDLLSAFEKSYSQ